MELKKSILLGANFNIQKISIETRIPAPCTIARHLSSLKLNKAAFFLVLATGSKSRRLVQNSIQLHKRNNKLENAIKLLALTKRQKCSTSVTVIKIRLQYRNDFLGHSDASPWLTGAPAQVFNASEIIYTSASQPKQHIGPNAAHIFFLL